MVLLPTPFTPLKMLTSGLRFHTMCSGRSLQRRMISMRVMYSAMISVIFRRYYVCGAVVGGSSVPHLQSYTEPVDPAIPIAMFSACMPAPAWGAGAGPTRSDLAENKEACCFFNVPSCFSKVDLVFCPAGRAVCCQSSIRPAWRQLDTRAATSVRAFSSLTSYASRSRRVRCSSVNSFPSTCCQR